MTNGGKRLQELGSSCGGACLGFYQVLGSGQGDCTPCNGGNRGWSLPAAVGVPAMDSTKCWAVASVIAPPAAGVTEAGAWQHL